MTKLEKMAIANGTCTYDGARYILTQQAYPDGPNDAPVYCAGAIREMDKPDEDGWQPAFEVEWDVLEDYDPALGDEGCACDWNHADRVREIGEYNVEIGRFA